jgi:hypothetical protein
VREAAGGGQIAVIGAHYEARPTPALKKSEESAKGEELFELSLRRRVKLPWAVFYERGSSAKQPPLVKFFRWRNKS